MPICKTEAPERKRIPEKRFETALTGGSPAWSGTSSPGRQKKTGSQRLRPPAGSRTPLPSSGQRANSPGPRVPRTWYSASSSLDRRLPEPPIAAPRAQLHQLFSGRRQLSHFRPRAASPPRPRGNRFWGWRPRTRPLLKAPRRSQPGSAAGSQLRAVPGNLEEGPGAGPEAEPKPHGPASRSGRGGARHAACVRACRLRMR